MFRCFVAAASWDEPDHFSRAKIDKQPVFTMAAKIKPSPPHTDQHSVEKRRSIQNVFLAAMTAVQKSINICEDSVPCLFARAKLCDDTALVFQKKSTSCSLLSSRLHEKLYSNAIIRALLCSPGRPVEPTAAGTPRDSSGTQSAEFFDRYRVLPHPPPLRLAVLQPPCHPLYPPPRRLRQDRHRCSPVFLYFCIFVFVPLRKKSKTAYRLSRLSDAGTTYDTCPTFASSCRKPSCSFNAFNLILPLMGGGDQVGTFHDIA